MSAPVRLLLVSGSLRDGSTNTATLRTVAAHAPGGAVTTRYEGMGTLPHFNPDDDREGEPVAAPVAGMRAAVAASDAILFCTPEYAGALPGSFKNLLEWTVGDAGTYGRPVAWINVSGRAAPSGGGDAHASLAKVLAYTGADIVEAACARVPLARDMIGADGLVADVAARDAILAAVGVLVAYAAEKRSSSAAEAG